MKHQSCPSSAELEAYVAGGAAGAARTDAGAGGPAPVRGVRAAAGFRAAVEAHTAECQACRIALAALGASSAPSPAEEAALSWLALDAEGVVQTVRAAVMRAERLAPRGRTLARALGGPPNIPEAPPTRVQRAKEKPPRAKSRGSARKNVR